MPRGFQGTLEKELEPWLGHEGGDCYKRELLHIKGLCTANIFVYGKGGKRLIFPEHVGFPIAEKPQDEYYVVEVHYDNPKLTKDIHYHTGIRVFYTENLRPKDAGFLYVGHEVDASITIAPDAPNWKVTGHCAGSCTQEKFPENGVNFFNVLLHAHLASRKMKLRHFRDGEELPWIAYDNSYDFNFQQTRPLRKEINVRKGDHLTVECRYDTTWKKPLTAVTGGLSSYSEMCEAWVFYWPRMPDLDVCTSSLAHFKSLLRRAGITNVSTEQDQYHPLVLEPASLQGLTYDEVLSNKVDWTDGFRKGFQDDLLTSDHASLCVSYADYATPAAGQYDDDLSTPRTNYPKIRKAYEPPTFNCPADDAEPESQDDKEEEGKYADDQVDSDDTADDDASPPTAEPIPESTPALNDDVNEE